MSKTTKPGVLLLLVPGILASFGCSNQSAPAPHESVKREQELPLTLAGFLSDGIEDTGKDVSEILGPAHLSDQEQADAFNAYFEGNDEQAFKRRFRKFNVPDDLMRELLAKRFPPGYTTVRTDDGRVLHLKNANLSADEIAQSIAAHRALESEKVDGVCGTDV